MSREERIKLIEQKCSEKSIICCHYPEKIVADTILTLSCTHHNLTWTSTYSNLKAGKGCPKCAGNKKISVTEWYERIDQRILNSALPYIILRIPEGNKKSRCHLYCVEHGVSWDCSLEKAAKTAVCPECSCTRHLTVEEREKSLLSVLPSHLHFSRWLGYVNAKCKVEIYCSQHDIFHQQWLTHVLKAHLPTCCTKYGFDFKGKGYLYVLESDTAVKIGISNNVKQRINTLKTQTPFNFKLIKSICRQSGRDVYDLELLAHQNFRSANMSGFDGCTEWLEKSEDLKEWVKRLK